MADTAPTSSADAADAAKKKAEADWYARMGIKPGTTGTDYANTTFAPGVMGTLTDAHAAQSDAALATEGAGLARQNANLDRLKGNLGGLTAEENRAAMEQGQAGVQNEMKQNLERYAARAGGQGVRGAANAALQGKAYTQANQDTAAYNRQLILDNVSAKQAASQAYTGAGQAYSGAAGAHTASIGGVADRSLGVANTNIGLRNAELYGRTSTPFQFGSALDAAGAGGAANYYTGAGLDASKNYLSTLPKPTDPNAPKELNKVDAAGQHTMDEADKTLGDYGTKMRSIAWGDALQAGAIAGDARNAIKDKIMAQYPDESESSQKAKIDSEMQKWSAANKAGADAGGKWGGKDACCYVCTAAVESGVLDAGIYEDTVTNCPTKPHNVGAYDMWGPVLASLVASNVIVRSVIAFVLPDTLSLMKGRKRTLRGYLGYYGIYIPLTTACNIVRWFRGSR